MGPPPELVERTTPTVVVEAIRPAELPEDPTSFTTVIETEQFHGETKTLDAMLEQSPGVHVRRYGGPGQPAEISIRGSTGSQVVILLDGVRLNTAQSGTVDLSTIPPSIVERIEVSRGGGSVNTGSDAIGGVVNIITKRAGSEPETTLVGGGGSFGTWQASGTQTGRIADIEALVGYDFFRTDGDFDFEPGTVIVDGEVFPELVGSIERINNESENHSGLLKLARDFGENLRLSFTDDLFYGSAGRPGPAFGPGVTAQQSPTAHQRRTRNVANLGLRAVDLLGLGVDGDFRAFHRYDRNRFKDRTPPFGAPSDADNRNHSLGGRARLERGLTLGFSEHLGSLGIETRGDWLESLDAGDRERLTVGVFAQDDVSLWDSWVRLVPALRFDYTDDFESEWIPRVGLVVEPLRWLRFKGNYERAYRVPNFDELYFNAGPLRGNPNLRPEDSWNGDGGVELGFDRLGPFDDVHVEAAGFYNDIDNSIVFQLVSSNVVAASNTGKARVSGAEVSGGLALGWLAFTGSYTYLDTEVRRTNEPLPGRPKHEYHLRLVFSPPNEVFKLVGESVYTSTIPANFAGNAFIGSRTVYHASLAVDFAKIGAIPENLRLRSRSLILSVTGTNLTDQAVRDAIGFPQPGRTLMFRGEVGW